jgi:cobyrinic acid a,c-diamide synthase
MSVGPVPRVVVAGLSGDAGKTLVSLTLLAAARARGLSVAAFKKGPDYIDAAWLSWAAGKPARNLDTFLVPPAAVAASFWRHAVRSHEPEGPVRLASRRALNLIEGNRGLFDGFDAVGSHSTAALARLLDAPVLMVLGVRKTTGTAAALVKGCQALDPRIRIAGVVLNHVGGARHETVVREAIENACGVPVLGAIPRLEGSAALPDRHLGLVPPAERPDIDDTARLLQTIASEYLDVDAVFRLASTAGPMAVQRDRVGSAPLGGAGDVASAVGVAGPGTRSPVTVGYVSDPAFSFYYPENLEALEARGARLVKVSSLAEASLPRGLDALYIGGGFPETHAEAIEGNRPFLESLRNAADGGLPMYAECGGLILLARSLTWRGRRHAMAGVFDADVELFPSLQGHGYMTLRVEADNPFFERGFEFRAHEFHYSRITSRLPDTACAVVRGTGCGDGRDGLIRHNAWASYAHVHAAGLPQWADGLVAAARRRAGLRRKAGRLDPV